ncbi:MAG TPA: hypothetical protein VF792_10100 [Ktedonobacterales bacterium]
MQRPTERPRSMPLPAPPSQPRRLQLSALIDDRIQSINSRERHRMWLVNTVVLAQALITLMVAPGYLIPSANLPVLISLGVALAFYLMAFLFNLLRHELRVAVYLLIGGGLLATTALVFVSALLSHDSAHTAQSALLFLPIVLEAGLFLTPELTLFVASAAAIVTASAVLLAVAFTSDASAHLSEVYLVMVYALGLEVFIGYLAWRLAQFIYETVKNSQADEDLRFSRARLAATEQQINDQRRQLSQDIGAIQMAVSAALAHEYDTGIETVSGDLSPLASSVNLLIQQLRSTNELERKLQRMDAQAVTLVEMAGRLATGAGPLQRNDMPADNSLYSVSVALQQAQASIVTRQVNLQELAASIADSLKHGREDFVTMAQESELAKQVAGRLISLAESMVTTSQRQSELLSQARRALALVLPRELTEADFADGLLRDPMARDGESTGDLSGLGTHLGIMQTGLTGYYEALPPSDEDSPKIAPMTAQLKAIGADSDEEQASAQVSNEESISSLAQGELPAGLADVWLLLTQLQSYTTAEARAASTLTYDLGVLGRHVRQTSQGMDRVNQSMLTSERGADHMQRLAGGGAFDFGDEAFAAAPGFDGQAQGFARPAPTSTGLARGPVQTRPLGGDQQPLAESLALDASQPLQNDSNQQPSVAPGTLRVSSLIDLDAFAGRTGSGSLTLNALPTEQPEDEA